MVSVDPSSNPDVIRAAGGLLWSHGGRGPRLALVHRPRHGDWSLPKGKLKDGESWEQAAVREVQEETGCEIEVTSFAGTLSYMVRGRPKVVLFWNMRKVGERGFSPSEEVDQVIWLPRRAAARRLSHASEKALLDAKTQR